MTTVGKLLVIMNLVFSLVVGAFAVMDYTTRTHWAEGYKKLETQYTVAAGQAATFRSQLEQLSNEKAQLNAELAKAGGAELQDADSSKIASKAIAVLEARARAIDNLKKDLRDRDTRMAQLELKVKTLEGTTSISVEDVNRRAADQAKLVEQIKTERTRNDQLVKEKNDLLDAKTAAEIDRDAYKDRATSLAAEVARLEKDLVTARALASGMGASGRLPGTLAKSPPPSNVEGLVKKVDNNLITISIGSDDGIQRGHELSVFRLGTNPKYIGMVRIVEVTPKSA
ncbi:MAG: hypothetical protein SNJ75_13875, partial [Gemmataceae bacterium]